MKKNHLSLKVMSAIVSALLFSLSLSAQLSTRIDYDDNTHRFELINEPPLEPYPTMPRQPYWEYRWEFGDGHFSDQKSPVHQYERPGIYEVRLYLTPFYSITKPKLILGASSSRGGRNREVEYDLQRRNVYLNTNTPSSLIPGDEFQVALMYGNGDSRSTINEGYLFFFYNRSGEVPVKYKRLQLIDEIRTLEDREVTTSPATVVSDHLSEEVSEAALEDLNDYEDVAVFKIEDLGNSEQRNIFLNLRTDWRLTSQQNKTRTLSLAALFVPTSGDFHSRQYRMEKELSILAVYDPNRIRVAEKRLYFHPQAGRTLTYTIDFQNKEEGIAQDVRIMLPMEKGLSTADTEVETLDPVILPCPQDTDPDLLEISCYQQRIVRSGKRRVPDSLRIDIYNIGLRGKKSLGFFQSKGSSKGKIQVKIKSDTTRTPTNAMQAKIYFDQVEPVETNTTRTRWKRRSWFLRPQFGIDMTADNFFSYDPGSATDRIGGGISIVDAPLKNGIMKGIEFTYSPLSFSRTADDLSFFDDFWLLREEFTRLHLLDLNVLVGYQFNGNIRLSTGLGVSLPLIAKTEFLELFSSSPEGPFELGNSYEAQYGWIRLKDGDNDLFPLDDLSQSIGGLWRTSLEIGLLDRISVGISQDIRYFPKLYNCDCGQFNTYTVFARLRLFDAKRF